MVRQHRFSEIYFSRIMDGMTIAFIGKRFYQSLLVEEFIYQRILIKMLGLYSHWTDPNLSLPLGFLDALPTGNR